jgi:hypothetical protein
MWELFTIAFKMVCTTEDDRAFVAVTRDLPGRRKGHG